MSTEILEIVTRTSNIALDKLVQVLHKRSKGSFIGAAIFLISVHQVLSYFRVPKNLRHIPRVSTFALAKSFLSGESRLSLAQRLLIPTSVKGNGFYLSKIPFNWTVNVCNPLAAKQLCLKSGVFPKSHLWQEMLGKNGVILNFIGNNSVVMSNGESWKKQRALINPIFHRSMPIKTMGGVVKSFFAAIDKQDGNIDIANKMQQFTLDILGVTTFDYDFQSLNGDPEDWLGTFESVSNGLFSPAATIFSALDPLFLLISPTRKKCQKSLEYINNKFDEIAQKKRELIRKGVTSNTPESEKNLLTLMLEAEQRGEVMVDPIELRQNIAVFFLAGHETTSIALSFCLYNLAKYKHIQRKLRQEIIDVMGDEPIDAIPTLEELRRMDYMNLVIKENLRLYSPADSPIPRRTTEDVNLAGTFIPKGTDINLDMQCLHHNSDIWQNPEEFIPERFQEYGEQASHEGFTYLPFSSGSRQCIGMNFSLAEQRVFLAMAVRKYEIDIPKDSIHYKEIVFDFIRTRAPMDLELILKRRY
ncbi:unnamed protein product [Rhizopus stolonifer]